MSLRIPVVISQHELRSGHRSEFEERLITRLLFESGLDATLISALKDIEPDTTDHLCLEGLKGDFALLSWEDFEYASIHLARLIDSSFTIVSLLSGTTLKKASSHKDLLRQPKRVFFCQLDASGSIDSLVGSLKLLVESKSVPVVSLVSNKSRNDQALEVNSSVTSPTSNDSTWSKRSSSPAESSQIAGLGPIPAKAPSVPRFAPIDLADDEFPHIDQLVDDLDSFEM